MFILANENLRPRFLACNFLFRLIFRAATHDTYDFWCLVLWLRFLIPAIFNFLIQFFMRFLIFDFSSAIFDSIRFFASISMSSVSDVMISISRLQFMISWLLFNVWFNVFNFWFHSFDLKASISWLGFLIWTSKFIAWLAISDFVENLQTVWHANLQEKLYFLLPFMSTHPPIHLNVWHV